MFSHLIPFKVFCAHLHLYGDTNSYPQAFCPHTLDRRYNFEYLPWNRIGTDLNNSRQFSIDWFGLWTIKAEVLSIHPLEETPQYTLGCYRFTEHWNILNYYMKAPLFPEKTHPVFQKTKQISHQCPMQTTAPGRLVELQHSQISHRTSNSRGIFFTERELLPPANCVSTQGAELLEALPVATDLQQVPRGSPVHKKAAGQSPVQDHLPALLAKRQGLTQAGERAGPPCLLPEPSSSPSCHRGAQTGDVTLPGVMSTLLPGLRATWATGLLQQKCWRGARGVTEENGTRSSSWFSVTLQLWPTLDNVLRTVTHRRWDLCWMTPFAIKPKEEPRLCWHNTHLTFHWCSCQAARQQH